MRRKTTKSRYAKSAHKGTSSILPIDTRIFPDIISFGHVHGASRVFLTIEICLVTFVMIGSLVLAFGKVFR